MDILILIKDQWISFVVGLSEGVISYILRMALLLSLSIITLTLSWYSPRRSVVLQMFIFFFVICLTLCISVQNVLELEEGQFVFGVTTSFLLMIFIPNFLPFLLHPRFGTQIKIRKLLLISIWGLFLVQLFIAR